MKKILAIAGHGYEDVELIGTLDILNKKGIKYTLASVEKEDYIKSKTGIKIIPKLKLLDIKNKLDDYDAIFFPGGPGTEALLKNKLISEVLEHFKLKDKIISAICAAPSILAVNNVLQDKKVVCYPDKNIVELVINNGATISEGKNVVVDNKLVTGKDMLATMDFANELASLILSN